MAPIQTYGFRPMCIEVFYLVCVFAFSIVVARFIWLRTYCVVASTVIHNAWRLYIWCYWWRFIIRPVYIYVICSIRSITVSIFHFPSPNSPLTMIVFAQLFCSFVCVCVSFVPCFFFRYISLGLVLVSFRVFTFDFCRQHSGLLLMNDDNVLLIKAHVHGSFSVCLGVFFLSFSESNTEKKEHGSKSETMC